MEQRERESPTLRRAQQVHAAFPAHTLAGLLHPGAEFVPASSIAGFGFTRALAWLKATGCPAGTFPRWIGSRTGVSGQPPMGIELNRSFRFSFRFHAVSAFLNQIFCFKAFRSFRTVVSPGSKARRPSLSQQSWMHFCSNNHKT